MNLLEEFAFLRKQLTRMSGFTSEIRTIQNVSGLLVESKHDTYFVEAIEESLYTIYKIEYGEPSGLFLGERQRECIGDPKEFFEEVEANEI